jgi:hypothetical protein
MRTLEKLIAVALVLIVMLIIAPFLIGTLILACAWGVGAGIFNAVRRMYDKNH